MTPTPQWQLDMVEEAIHSKSTSSMGFLRDTILRAITLAYARGMEDAAGIAEEYVKMFSDDDSEDRNDGCHRQAGKELAKTIRQRIASQ